MTYVCLIRGINVSGQKLVKMERLRAAFEAAGFKDVRTYVQSGNVVFTSDKADLAALSKRIQKLIHGEFGHEVELALRSAAELGKVFKANPFLKRAGVERARLYVAFLSEKPGKAALAGLARYATAGELYRCAGREIFLFYPEGYGRSKLNNNVIERALSCVATTRNWNTVGKLVELAGSGR